MNGTFLFLGTGGSAGVPVIGCSCAVCRSTSSYNHRLRPSGLLKIDGKTLLIDVGPDFRTQALKYGIDHLDGLILTHTHYDHIAGIDDLRTFYLKTRKKLPCLLSRMSLDDLEKRYYYLFHPIGTVPTLSAQLEIHLLPHAQGEGEFLGIKIGYITYKQGGCQVNGFRFGNFAYITDIREFENSIFESLVGVKTLVISALREESSPLHLSLQEAIDFVKKVGARRTWITHISHSLDHESTNRKLPKSIQLGYDGLELEFQI